MNLEDIIRLTEEADIQWAEAPRRIDYHSGMRELLIPLGKDHTLRLYADTDAVHLVVPVLAQWINRTVKDHLTVEPMLRTAQQVNPTGKESLQVELRKAYADWSTAFATADKAWKDAYKADKERDAAAKRVSSLNAAIRARGKA